MSDEPDVDEVDEYEDDDDYEDDDEDVDGGDAATVLEYLVREIVSDPDAVQVEVDDRGRRLRLNVFVGDGDMGRVIGKRGRVAQAIRTVVRAAASRDGNDVEVEFVD